MKFDVFFYMKASAPCPGSPKERLIFSFNLSKVLLCERGREEGGNGDWKVSHYGSLFGHLCGGVFFFYCFSGSCKLPWLRVPNSIST